MLSQADRQAFSLAIINDAAQITGLQLAITQEQAQLVKDQALDTANGNLFGPANTLINQYQAEINLIDGNNRTSITDQNLTDSANRVLGNYFYPNSTSLSIPSLSALNNIWSQTTPFALAYGVGLPYNQTFTPGTSEESLISTIQGYITSAASYTQIQLASGQYCVDGDTCSLPIYDGDEADCLSNSGIWTAVDTVQPYPVVQLLGTNIVSTVNSLVTQLNLEVTALETIVDPNPTNQAQNTAAINYINNTLLPALNAWIAYPTFNSVPGSITTCAAFNSYDPSLLSPTKLYSTQLSALQSALTARSTFLSSTRVPQINTILGTVTQTISTGAFSGSGLYFTRFTYINLRLNLLSGSLSNVTNDQLAINTQMQMIANLNAQVAAYQGICPTILLSSAGSGTAVISLVSSTGFSAGDTVYITSNNQPEMQFAIKSINGNSIQLNTSLSSKYTTLDQTRFYKDIS